MTTIQLPFDARGEIERSLPGKGAANVAAAADVMRLLESWRVPETREEPVNLCETPEDAARRFAGCIGNALTVIAEDRPAITDRKAKALLARVEKALNGELDLTYHAASPAPSGEDKQ